MERGTVRAPMPRGRQPGDEPPTTVRIEHTEPGPLTHPRGQQTRRQAGALPVRLAEGHSTSRRDEHGVVGLCGARRRRSGIVAGSEVSSAGRGSTASGLGVGRGEVIDPNRAKGSLDFLSSRSVFSPGQRVKKKALRVRWGTDGARHSHPTPHGQCCPRRVPAARRIGAGQPVNLRLTEEQQALRETFAALFAKECTPDVVRAAEPLGHDASLWATDDGHRPAPHRRAR